jgi:hypothetical protein
MTEVAGERARKFHEIFQKAKRSKFDHEYRIDTCEIPKEPGMCLVFQLDKKTNKMDMTLLGKEGAEAFSILSPINERIVERYKSTKEFKEKRKLYINS